MTRFTIKIYNFPRNPGLRQQIVFFNIERVQVV